MEILIAGINEVIKEGLMKIILDELPCTLLKEVSSFGNAIIEGNNKKYDLLIIELSIPKRGGLEILKQLRLSKIRTPILLYSLNEESLTAIRVLKAGGNGYVSTDNSKITLVKAIRTILDGRKYITPEIAERLACGFKDYRIMEHECITDRELQVLKLIGHGESITEISKKLILSVSTISTYRRRILEKMGLKNNSAIMHYVMESNLL